MSFTPGTVAPPGFERTGGGFDFAVDEPHAAEERRRDEHGTDSAKGGPHACMTLRGVLRVPRARAGAQEPGSSRNATVLSTRGSPGRPSTRSPITLRWICSVPPPMRLLHCIRNCCCQYPLATASPS